MGNEEILTEHRVDTVLIVDDEQALRSVLGKMLINEGCRVLTAADGTEAQALLQAHPEPISVVILDWIMPGISGDNLCRKLRELPTLRPLYIILLTVRRDKADVVAGLEDGLRFFPCQMAGFQVGLAAGLLDQGQGSDQRIVNAVSTDGKVMDRPLGVNAPSRHPSERPKIPGSLFQFWFYS